MTEHRSMSEDARTRLATGSRWTYKGETYVIAKITCIRMPGGWVDGVNYVPIVPKDDAPNDYTRTWDDFLAGFTPAEDG